MGLGDIMRGYECKICKKKGKKIELHYEQIQGMRCKREHDGKLMYHVWCPECQEYYWLKS